MLIYPAIDIRGGRCVRLSQGKDDARTDYFNDPVEPARRFTKAGAEWIHVVDLDGAFEGIPRNLEILKHIVDACDFYWCLWVGDIDGYKVEVAVSI